MGADIDVVVLEIDKENRRLSLGHKQLEENPWNEFETRLPLQDSSVMLRKRGGAIAKWLCTGLQIRSRQFDSASRLHNSAGVLMRE